MLAEMEFAEEARNSGMSSRKAGKQMEREMRDRTKTVNQEKKKITTIKSY